MAATLFTSSLGSAALIATFATSGFDVEVLTTSTAALASMGFMEALLRAGITSLASASDGRMAALPARRRRAACPTL